MYDGGGKRFHERPTPLGNPSATLTRKFHMGTTEWPRLKQLKHTLDPPLSGAPESWQVLQLNRFVASESIRDRPGPFARVLAALDPDVILLDEIFGGVTDAGLR